SSTPPSPRNPAIPEPSTTRPFLIKRSYAITLLLRPDTWDSGRLFPDCSTRGRGRRPLSLHGSARSYAKRAMPKAGGAPCSTCFCRNLQADALYPPPRKTLFHAAPRVKARGLRFFRPI